MSIAAGLFVLGRGEVVEAGVVVPVDPFRGGVLGLGEGRDRAVGLMHSFLQSPLMVSISALSYESPTLPVEGWRPLLGTHPTEHEPRVYPKEPEPGRAETADFGRSLATPAPRMKFGGTAPG